METAKRLIDRLRAGRDSKSAVDSALSEPDADDLDELGKKVKDFLAPKEKSDDTD